LKGCESKEGYAERFPFKMTQKRVNFSYDMPTAFKSMAKANHKTDGLLFTSQDAPYTFGTCQKM